MWGWVGGEGCVVEQQDTHDFHMIHAPASNMLQHTMQQPLICPEASVRCGQGASFGTEGFISDRGFICDSLCHTYIDTDTPVEPV